MDVKIDIREINKYSHTLKENEKSIEKAIDELWSNDETNPWVKRPMNISKNEIEEIMITALAAQDSCGMFVVIGSENHISGAKGIIESIGKTVGTAPIMEFIGENICNFTLDTLEERMRHYEINVCVISQSGEDLPVLATYSKIKEYMDNRYGQEISSKRIMVISGKGESSLKKIAEDSGSGIFMWDESYEGGYSIFNYANLFIMAVAGIDIERFMSGAEVMATDTSWDIDAGYYGLLRYLRVMNNGYKAEILNFFQEDIRNLINWIKFLNIPINTKSKSEDCNLTMYGYNMLSGKLDISIFKDMIFNTTISTGEAENEKVFFIDGEEINSLRLNKKIFGYTIENNEIYNFDVSIYIDKRDEFHLGQLAYFFMMSSAITSKLFMI